mmetsp:Transcript_2310/g.6833  ORF Transcript_2310/g.6833 Transcript_2310/m.6833 type:complete len:243 (+) Transcript_2310:348-1076(+)
MPLVAARAGPARTRRAAPTVPRGVLREQLDVDGGPVLVAANRGRVLPPTGARPPTREGLLLRPPRGARGQQAARGGRADGGPRRRVRRLVRDGRRRDDVGRPRDAQDQVAVARRNPRLPRGGARSRAEDDPRAPGARRAARERRADGLGGRGLGPRDDPRARADPSGDVDDVNPRAAAVRRPPARLLAAGPPVGKRRVRRRALAPTTRGRRGRLVDARQAADARDLLVGQRVRLEDRRRAGV